LSLIPHTSQAFVYLFSGAAVNSMMYRQVPQSMRHSSFLLGTCLLFFAGAFKARARRDGKLQLNAKLGRERLF
jgi:hypothetical protein